MILFVIAREADPCRFSNEMRQSSLFPLLAALFLVKATLFCLVLRPWLGPDEAIRFEYARLFSQSGFKTLTPAGALANQSEVLRSMTLFKAWDFMDLPTPDDLGHQAFQNSPLQKDTASTTYPPLYYFLLGNFWRATGTEALLVQLYSGRLVSLIFGILQLALLVLIARRAWPQAESNVRLCAVVFVAFLPQWGYLSSSIHSDNWSNLLASVLLLLFLKLVDGLDRRRRKIMSRARTSRFYLLLVTMLAAVMVLMTLSTRATAIIAVILALGFAFVLIPRIWNSAAKHRMLLLLSIIVFAAISSLFWFVVQQGVWLPEEWNEALGRGLMQRGAYIPTQELGSILSHFDRVNPENMLRSLAVMFVTFWLALGTLVYKLSTGWLVALGLVSAACAWGWLKRPHFLSVIRSDPMWLLFWIAPATTLAAVFYLYGPHQSYAPEGRYLLLVMPAIAILMTEGWCRCFSDTARRTALAVWICSWVFLNGIVLFQYVIPLYYLQQS